ncbi:PREDICTED: putative F-box protein At3g58860 [Camelina sativa]|uniref:F-box protein At3g58860 n=1 Tax=Camelina sativa TaxID=90675 RepID=A0ABM0YXN0_CAMSA|nr:PREDICTED: putative F-box protein At3g58860 [Camelina sativa]
MDSDKMDLFNTLPDEVVSRILSSLSTKEAASTSVLAKRWRNLFAFVPDLDFDDSVFLHPEEGKREKDGILQSFMDFLERVLALQGDSPIKKFSLNVKIGVDPDRVDRWICNVLRRGVSHLDLFMDFEEEYSLPYQISVSMTLVELKAGGYGVDLYSWGDDMFLPMLKTLVLESVGFGRGQFQTLLPACPVLEELTLVDMEWRDRNEILSSSSLKTLKITSEDGCLGTISFDTPNLVFLDYYDFVAEDYPVVNLNSLVEVGLNLVVNEDRFDQARDNVWKLIHGIRNAQIFHISPVTFEVLSLCCEAMPVFKNLTILNVRSVVQQGWQAMPLLLRNCPRLESLYLGGLLHTVTEKCGYVCDCISRKKKGRSLMSCPVKKIQIQGYRGTIRETHMIKHFLDYCPSLEEMEIIVEEKEATLFEIPKWFELVEDTLMHYNELSSCTVNFRVLAPLYWRWTRK